MYHFIAHAHPHQTDAFVPVENLKGYWPNALLYGYSVYTTFRYPLPAAMLNLHINRVLAHADILNIATAFWKESRLAWCQNLHKFLKILSQKQDQPAWAVRMTLFPDIQDFTELSALSSNLLSATPPPCSSLLISCRRFTPSRELLKPVSLKPVSYQRPLPHLKHGSTGGDFLYKAQVQLTDSPPLWDDALWINAAGHITEASTANIFLIQKNQLLTPSSVQDGCLAGLARTWLMEYLNKLPEEVEKSIAPDELPDMEAAFLSNAVSGFRLVSQIGEHPFQPSPETLSWLKDLQFQWNQQFKHPIHSTDS